MPFRTLAYLATFFLLFAGFAHGQRDWEVSLKSPQVFIENLGQYDALAQGFGDEARYVIDHGFGWQVILGDKGIHYLIQRQEREVEAVPEEHEAAGPSGKILSSRISMEFVGASSQKQIQAIGQQSDYYTYSYPVGESFVNVDAAHGFERLQLLGLYPGIDAEVKGEGDRGVKYSFQVHAGANPSQIRLRWKGASPTLDSQGQVHLPAVLGELVDQAPKAWYADDASVYIPVEFVLQGDEVTFALGSYDHNRAIVIDPWTVNPALPAPFNRAFEVDYDAGGNVYVFGGGMGYNLKKYNSAGTLQWTHVSPWDTSNAWFGELLTLAAGDVFITSGSAAKIRRLTTGGATTFTNNGPFLNMDEYWTLVLSCDNTKLISGGTRIVGLTSPQGFIFNLNMTNGNQQAGSPYNVSPFGMKEIRALCTAGNGNYYMLSNDNLICLNQTFGIVYSIATGVSHPYYSPAYMAKNVQGMNVIDANTTHIYLNNGNTLQKRDINTGAVVASTAITGGGWTGGFFGSGNTNGGLVLDACNNVYVGSTAAIYKYDANLNLLGSVATTGAIYDLTIPAAGTLIAGGNALVMSNTTLSPCAPKVIACVVLPVELEFLAGECENGTAKIQWATTKETEMQHFDVERTLDGVNWVKAGQVQAMGNSAERQAYRFEEAIPSGIDHGTCYYRLQMVDRNGTSHVSGIATLEGCGANDANAMAYPSVTEGPVEVEFGASKEGKGILSVIDIQGRTVKTMDVAWMAGRNRLDLSLQGLAAGSYQIQIKDGVSLERHTRVVKK